MAVDSSTAEQGHRTFQVGVALEIKNGGRFDDYYYSFVDEFSEEYNLELGHNIIKSRDIVNRIPSYEIIDAEEFVVENLVNNPAIRRIHVTLGWYMDDAYVGERGKEYSGIRFANDIMSQYFPIVTLWNYHRYHPDWDAAPTEAWIDNVQGKISKSWIYVGNTFDINIVPFGDVTYPSLSTADIIARRLARTIPRDKPFDDLAEAAAGIIIGNINGPVPRVNAESVNENHPESDHLVPMSDYSIKGQLYFPHPVLFLYDDIFSSFDQEVLPQTDFHAFARKWAQDNAGCVLKMEPHLLPTIVRSGDRIVYTDGTSEDVPQLLRDLNPTKDIQICSSSEFLEETLNG